MIDQSENNQHELSHISDSEIIKIVLDTVNSFDEVSRFVETSITENINIKVLGKEPLGPGIKIVRDNNALQIHLHLIVFFNVNIPQLSYDLQSKIKNNIESKTGLSVNIINISVEGIDCLKENI